MIVGLANVPILPPEEHDRPLLPDPLGALKVLVIFGVSLAVAQALSRFFSRK